MSGETPNPVRARRRAGTLGLLGAALLAVSIAPEAPGQCRRQLLLGGDPATVESFGAAIDVDGDVAVIGAPETNGPSEGAVFVHRRDAASGAWSLEAELALPSGSYHDAFGAAVAVSGDVIAVGAPGHTEGTVWMYRFDGAQWNQETSLDDPTVHSSGSFGDALDLDGDTVAIGNYGDVGRDGGAYGFTGSVSVFRYEAGSWQLEAELFADDGVPGDHFGSAVCLQRDRLLVGAEGDDPAGDDAGSAYVFTRTGGRWSQTAKLLRQLPGASERFGSCAALDGDVAVIGSGGEIGPAQPGSATIFRRRGARWTPVRVLTHPDGATADDFGSAVALRDGRLAIGARRTDEACPCPQGCDSGSVLLYKRTGSTWSPSGRLLPPDVEAGDRFGSAVAFAGDAILVGAPFDDDLADDAGAVAVIDLGGEDCNGNAACDDDEIASGAAPDVDGNAVPDACDPDCNDNGLPDGLDVAGGASADVDGDGVPDECQDCNGNGVLDPAEIASGAAADCNADGVPDECQADCNGNGVPDDCDLASGSSADCNANGVIDDCDIAAGASPDADGDGIPDECAIDCNGNGVPDLFDVVCGDDCNDNGIPDECEPDCNEDSIPDDCEIAMGWFADCNGNGVPDICDVEDGASPDCDENHVPDECDPTPLCPGNTDPDCDVDVADLVNVVLDFDTDGAAHHGDVDRDGIVTVGDIVLVVLEWGPCFNVACGPGAGPCEVANGTPGCEDEACCTAVCNDDPFCCEVAWDPICASNPLCGH